MGKCLIVFTRKYPYSYGEPSFQDEVPYYLPLFEKILVLSQDVGKGEPITRTPPAGVAYYNTATSSRKVGRIKDKLKCGRQAFRKSEALASDAGRVKGHLVRRVFLWSFEERCQRLIREATAILDSYDFSQFEEVVLYSYWFFANVRVAVGVSEYLRRRGCGRVRIISRAHRYDLYETRNRLNYLPMREYLLRKVEKVYVCSQNGADYLRAGHPQYADKIDVGYVGTLDCGVAEAPREPVFHLVSCCRIVPVKRLERLADAMALVEEPCKWTVIGGGVEGGGYYQELQKYITAALASRPNVQVEYTGALPHDEIFRYYQTHRVDALVNPSESEGLPAVIMEAASFGIPSIATDVGGTSEIVLDELTGYLIPERFTTEQLAGCIRRMIALPEAEYAALRRSAREVWQEKFNALHNNAWFAQRVFEGEKTE